MNSLLKDRPVGPVASYAEGLGRSLSDLGYAATTAEIHLRRLGALDGWLVEEHLGLDELTEPVLARFIASGRAGGGNLPVSMRGLGPVLGFLRGAGVIPPAPVVAATRSRLCWTPTAAIWPANGAWRARRWWAARRSWPAS